MRNHSELRGIFRAELRIVPKRACIDPDGRQASSSRGGVGREFAFMISKTFLNPEYVVPGLKLVFPYFNKKYAKIVNP